MADHSFSLELLQRIEQENQARQEQQRQQRQQQQPQPTGGPEALNEPQIPQSAFGLAFGPALRPALRLQHQHDPLPEAEVIADPAGVNPTSWKCDTHNQTLFDAGQMLFPVKILLLFYTHSRGANIERLYLCGLCGTLRETGQIENCWRHHLAQLAQLTGKDSNSDIPITPSPTNSQVIQGYLKDWENRSSNVNRPDHLCGEDNSWEVIYYHFFGFSHNRLMGCKFERQSMRLHVKGKFVKDLPGQTFLRVRPEQVEIAEIFQFFMDDDNGMISLPWVWHKMLVHTNVLVFVLVEKWQRTRHLQEAAANDGGTAAGGGGGGDSAGGGTDRGGGDWGRSGGGGTQGAGAGALHFGGGGGGRSAMNDTDENEPREDSESSDNDRAPVPARPLEMPIGYTRFTPDQPLTTQGQLTFKIIKFLESSLEDFPTDPNNSPAFFAHLEKMDKQSAFNLLRSGDTPNMHHHQDVVATRKLNEILKELTSSKNDYTLSTLQACLKKFGFNSDSREFSNVLWSSQRFNLRNELVAILEHDLVCGPIQPPPTASRTQTCGEDTTPPVNKDILKQIEKFFETYPETASLPDAIGTDNLYQLCRKDEYLPIVKRFIEEFGCDINIQRKKFGSNGGHLAVNKKQYGILNFLLSKGVSIFDLNNGGETIAFDENFKPSDEHPHLKKMLKWSEEAASGWQFFYGGTWCDLDKSIGIVAATHLFEKRIQLENDILCLDEEFSITRYGMEFHLRRKALPPPLISIKWQKLIDDDDNSNWVELPELTSELVESQVRLQELQFNLLTAEGKQAKIDLIKMTITIDDAQPIRWVPDSSKAVTSPIPTADAVIPSSATSPDALSEATGLPSIPLSMFAQDSNDLCRFDSWIDSSFPEHERNILREADMKSSIWRSTADEKTEDEAESKHGVFRLPLFSNLVSFIESHKEQVKTFCINKYNNIESMTASAASLSLSESSSSSSSSSAAFTIQVSSPDSASFRSGFATIAECPRIDALHDVFGEPHSIFVDFGVEDEMAQLSLSSDSDNHAQQQRRQQIKTNLQSLVKQWRFAAVCGARAFSVAIRTMSQKEANYIYNLQNLPISKTLRDRCGFGAAAEKDDWWQMWMDKVMELRKKALVDARKQIGDEIRKTLADKGWTINEKKYLEVGWDHLGMKLADGKTLSAVADLYGDSGRLEVAALCVVLSSIREKAMEQAKTKAASLGGYFELSSDVIIALDKHLAEQCDSTDVSVKETIEKILSSSPTRWMRYVVALELRLCSLVRSCRLAWRSQDTPPSQLIRSGERNIPTLSAKSKQLLFVALFLGSAELYCNAMFDEISNSASEQSMFVELDAMQDGAVVGVQAQDSIILPGVLAISHAERQARSKHDQQQQRSWIMSLSTLPSHCVFNGYGRVFVVESNNQACITSQQRCSQAFYDGMAGYILDDGTKYQDSAPVVYVHDRSLYELLRNVEDASELPFDTILFDNAHERGVFCDLCIALVARRIAKHKQRSQSEEAVVKVMFMSSQLNDDVGSRFASLVSSSADDYHRFDLHGGGSAEEATPEILSANLVDIDFDLRTSPLRISIRDLSSFLPTPLSETALQEIESDLQKLNILNTDRHFTDYGKKLVMLPRLPLVSFPHISSVRLRMALVSGLEEKRCGLEMIKVCSLLSNLRVDEASIMAQASSDHHLHIAREVFNLMQSVRQRYCPTNGDIATLLCAYDLMAQKKESIDSEVFESIFSEQSLPDQVAKYLTRCENTINALRMQFQHHAGLSEWRRGALRRCDDWNIIAAALSVGYSKAEYPNVQWSVGGFLEGIFKTVNAEQKRVNTGAAAAASGSSCLSLPYCYEDHFPVSAQPVARAA